MTKIEEDEEKETNQFDILIQFFPEILCLILV